MNYVPKPHTQWRRARGWTSIKLVDLDLTQTPDKGEIILIEAMELNEPRPN